MPFKIAPSRINGQPGFLFDEEERLRGFYDASLYRWVIVDTEHATPIVKVGEERTLALMPFLYNDQPVWGFSGAVFNSITDGWIYNPSGIYEPSAEKDIDGETWIGDGWWKAGKPNPEYPEIVCEPAGRYISDSEGLTPPTLLWWWPRWEWEKAGSSRAPWGTYVAKDGAEAVCARPGTSTRTTGRCRRGWRWTPPTPPACTTRCTTRSTAAAPGHNTIHWYIGEDD